MNTRSLVWSLAFCCKILLFCLKRQKMAHILLNIEKIENISALKLRQIKNTNETFWLFLIFFLISVSHLTNIPPLQGCSSAWQAEAGTHVIKVKESVDGDGVHRASHRPAAPERPRGQIGEWHVRHQTHIRLQDCPLRTKVRLRQCDQIWRNLATSVFGNF